MTTLEVAEEKLQGELHPYLIYAKKLVSLSTSTVHNGFKGVG